MNFSTKISRQNYQKVVTQFLKGKPKHWQSVSAHGPLTAFNEERHGTGGAIVALIPQSKSSSFSTEVKEKLIKAFEKAKLNHIKAEHIKVFSQSGGVRVKLDGKPNAETHVLTTIKWAIEDPNEEKEMHPTFPKN